MPLTLFLLRHAKTQPASSGEQDFDRPLYKEGVNQSIRLGQQLAALTIGPSKIISSPARRAKDTLLNVVQHLGIAEEKIHFDELIYTGDMEDLLQLIRATNNQNESLLVTGHNPTLSSVGTFLVRNFTEGMNPCDLVQIDFNLSDWSSLSKHSGTLTNLISGSSL